MSLARRLFPEMNQMLRMLEEPFFAPTRLFRPSLIESPMHAPWTRGILMDMKETKNSYEIDAELPGVKKEDVKIECKDDRTLVLSGKFGSSKEESSEREAPESFPIDESDGLLPSGAEKKIRDKASQAMHKAVAKAEGSQDVSVQEGPEKRYWHSERLFGEFQRSVTFPSPIQTEKIQAKFNNGLLSIILPKLEKKGVTVNIE